MSNGREPQQIAITFRQLIIILVSLAALIGGGVWAVSRLIANVEVKVSNLSQRLDSVFGYTENVNSKIDEHRKSSHPNPDYRDKIQYQFNECFKQVAECRRQLEELNEHGR